MLFFLVGIIHGSYGIYFFTSRCFWLGGPGNRPFTCASCQRSCWSLATTRRRRPKLFFQKALVENAVVFFISQVWVSRWWFQRFFIFTPNLGEDSHFANGVGSTTNQVCLFFFWAFSWDPKEAVVVFSRDVSFMEYDFGMWEYTKWIQLLVYLLHKIEQSC